VPGFNLPIASSEQNFRLSFWKVAAEEINYRRFFNINELISLRMEEEKVFTHFHTLIFDLIKDHTFSGLRIDHIDGLYDPTAYLWRMKERAGEDSYLVVEKILSSGEILPDFWPIEGTTGYDFLNLVNGIFCQRKNEKIFEKVYARFTGLNAPYAEVLYEKKKMIAETNMIGDADNIAHLFKRILSKDRHGSDLTIYGLKRAFIEIIALFPVYRTYLSKGFSRETDPSYIREAMEKAKKRSPGLLQEINFIEKVLLLQFGDYLSEKEREEWLHFVMRFQQFTGPNMAKGLEDTTLYVYNRLLSLNEVGGNPGEFGSHGAFTMSTKRELQAVLIHECHIDLMIQNGRGYEARINVCPKSPGMERIFQAWSKINRKQKGMLTKRCS
jgi:(1->4)-alpha-D-glucan 1-alpha-D-glucosylmutase